MADQVELTSSAVISRLRSKRVPNRVNDDGVVEHYLWAITDSQLHKYLTDSYYGQFTDAVDDLQSVTLPSHRKDHMWVFAPNVELIEWFDDATTSDDSQVNGDKLKMAYVKMIAVEESFDEHETPMTVSLTHPGSNKLYAYKLSDLITVNDHLINELAEGVDEQSALDGMDAELARNEQRGLDLIGGIQGSAKDLTAIDFSDDEDEDEANYDPLSFDDVNDEPSFDEADDVMMNTNMDDSVYGMMSGGDDDDDVPLPNDDADDVLSMTLEDNDNLEDNHSSSDTIPAVTPDQGLKQVPDALQHMLDQLDVPVLKAPVVRSNEESDSYRKKVDQARDDLNEQLRYYSTNLRHEILSEYYEKHALKESQIDAKLDAENGDDNIVAAYKQIEALRHQDESDLSQLTEQRRNELSEKLDDLRTSYLDNALRNAEAEWERIKDVKYVEEPLQEWRSEIAQRVDAQHAERMKRFNEWRERIKSANLTQVDAPIIEGLSSKIKAASEDLKREQKNAWHELRRIEDRLFNQSLEMQKIEIQQAHLPSVQQSEVSQTPSMVVTSPLDQNQVTFEDDDNNIFDGSDMVEQINVDDDNTDVVSDLNLDFDEDDEGSDVINSDYTPNNITLDFDDDIDDEDIIDEDAPAKYDVSNYVPATQPSDASDSRLSAIDEYVDNSDEALSEQSVIKNALADEDSDFDLDLDDLDDGDLDNVLDGVDETSDVMVDDDDNFDDDDDLLKEFDEEDEDSEGIAPLPSSDKKSDKKKKGLKKSKGDKGDKGNKKRSSSTGSMSKKKLIAITSGVAAVVIVGIIAVVLMFTGGANSGLKVSPSPTNTYNVGNMLSAKDGDKNVALIIKKVDGNKLVVSNVSNNKEYTINKPSGK